MNSFSNATTISESSSFSGYGAAVRNNNTITDFSNTGTISFTSGYGYALYNHSTGSIGTLNNSGTISSNSIEGNSFTNFNTLGSLNNSGTISSIGYYLSYSLQNGGSITSLLNTGTISGSTFVRTTDAFGIYNIGGTIGTLTNTGTISASTSSSGSGRVLGIENTYGTINIFNNLQGASGSAVTYTGKLPTNYNIIIASPTNYGQLTVTSPSLSTTFNIYGNTGTTLVSGVSASTLAVGTYSSILTGLTSSNIVSSSLSGTYTGGYTWQLVNTFGTTWDLVVATGSSGGGGSSSGSSTTTSSTSNITAGSIVTLNSLGVTYNPVLSGGTLALTNGNSSGVALSVLTDGGTIVSPNSGSATLSGVISGVGGLTFSGTGITVLTGVSTYSGGTTVANGTLSVAGSAPTGTGDIFVASPATIMGTGTISGNIVLSGTLKPGNSPGYLSTAKNVTFNSGGIYQQDIAGTMQANSASPVGTTGYYSFLTVGGQLIINSGAILAPMLQNLFQTTESGYGSVPYIPKLGDSFRIATAAGGVSGAFSSVTQPAGLTTGTKFIPFYNYAGGNSIDLAVIPTSYATALSGARSNTQSVAAVLDKLSSAQMAGTASISQTNMMYATATQTTSSLASFAQGLSGEIYANTLAIVPQTTQRIQSAVIAHISDTVMPVSAMNSHIGMPLSTNTITPQNPLGLPDASMSSNPEVNPAKDMALPANQRVWGEIAYQYANRSSDSNASGFNSNLYQAVFGADIYQQGNIKAGAGFALSTTNVSMNSGTGTVGQGALFAYGKTLLLQDYVLDGMASVGMNSTDVTRNDPTSTNSLKAKGIKGNDVLFSAGLSRSFEADHMTFTPYLRATWQMVSQSSFDEGTASSAALSVNKYNGNGARGLIGLAVGSKNKDPIRDPYTYKVNVAVGADTNTLINPALNANLASYGTSIQTANVGNTFVQAGLYGTAKFADNAYVYAGLTGEARSGQLLGGVSVGLRLQF